MNYLFCFNTKEKIDGLVKSRKTLYSVIFRFIGEVSISRWLQTLWTPVFTGVTTFYGIVKIQLPYLPLGYVQIYNLLQNGDQNEYLCRESIV